MYCIKCGADNLEAAKYCRKCGEDLSNQRLIVQDRPPFDDAEEETRVAMRKAVGSRQIGEDAGTDRPEAEIFSISPTLLFVKAGYAAAALGALLLVAAVSVFTSVSAWIAVLVGLLLFLIPAFYHIKQKIVRYTLTDSKLEIDEGFISRSTRSIPIRRIQDVTVSANITQRLLGFGDLMIDNASDEGGKVVLKNINSPKQYADVLLREMRRLEK